MKLPITSSFLLLGFCLCCWSACKLKTLKCSSPSKPEPALVCVDSPMQGLAVGKMNGISMVAPPHRYQEDPMLELNLLGANWVALLPYAGYQKGQPKLYTGGWWGECPEGIAEAANYAHKQGIKVMIKPQLWTHNQWIGDLEFDTVEEWKAFEKEYRAFIIPWAQLAERVSAELFCVGTEIRKSVQQRPEFWRQLIQDIRAIYSGQLTYAPNWDSYDKVSFWDDLDYIGVDAYFPLVDADTPTVCALKKAWIPYFKALKAFSEDWKRPILFTEYGYMSVDGAAYNTWELEARRGSLRGNELAQARAFQALFETFAPESWWAGGFLWKWYPSELSAMGEGGQSNDYTPQGKQGLKILELLFKP